MDIWRLELPGQDHDFSFVIRFRWRNRNLSLSFALGLKLDGTKFVVLKMPDRLERPCVELDIHSVG